MITLKAKKILVPYDFSPTAENAFKHAAQIAGITKGEIILLNVQKKNDLVNFIMPALKIKNMQVINEFMQKHLTTEAAAMAKKYGVKVKPIFSAGKISDEIIKMSKKENADLLVMGTQGGDSKNDFIMGSNTYRTLTKCELPILTVRSKVPRKGYANILLPIDLSEHSRQKVTLAINIAKLNGGTIHILGLYSDKLEKGKLQIYVEQVAKHCEKAKVPFEKTLEESNERVETTLERALKVKADLIVSMTDQDAEFSTKLLSNYIHELINTSMIPVLCLMPEVNDEIGSSGSGL